MKTPIWEASPGITRQVLANRLNPYTECDLYTINCATGPVLRYCTATRDVAYDPGSGLLTWSSKQVRVDDQQLKALAHWTVGLNVDTWQVAMYPRLAGLSQAISYPDRIGGIPFVEACNGGYLDGGVVQVDRAIFRGWSDAPPIYETPVGVYRMFEGDVAEIDYADNGIILNINSLLARLNVDYPNRLFQGLCGHTLFDPGCTLSRASFVRTGSIGSLGPADNQFVSSITAPSGSGTYTLGRLFMTSGPNAGFGRLVRAWDPSTGLFTLSAPFYFDLAPGDTFDATPGCDKRKIPTCVLFGNQANHMGQTNIPVPEVAI